MKLFKNKEALKNNADEVDSETALIKILGSGCLKCNDLEKNVVLALADLGLHHAIAHIKDFAQIASYGVMTTPALVINNTVVSFGKVLSVDEVKVILLKEGLHEK